MDFSKSDYGRFSPSESQWWAFQAFRLLYGKSSLSVVSPAIIFCNYRRMALAITPFNMVQL